MMDRPHLRCSAAHRLFASLTAVMMISGSFFACASPPDPQPIAVSRIEPGSGERVVDQVVIVFDTSGSIDESEQFPQARALVQSFVAAMPDGSYEVGAVAFGGPDRQVYAAEFDRSALGHYAANVEYLSDGTPLHTVITEVGSGLDGKSSKASLIVLTDGLPSDVIGRDVSGDLALTSARNLAGSYAGDLCIHTVQLGSDPAGAAFLQDLAAVTPCGSTRSVSSLDRAVAIESFGRDALLTPLPQVAAAPPANTDNDRDGVPNSIDQCPRTPAGAEVDSRGCWVIPELHFELESAEFRAASRETLDTQVLPVLEQNPNLRVQIGGYTDDSGAPAYNQSLSERRAQAVRDHLISEGIAARRLDAKGFGEADPIHPNDTPEGRKLNRRTEILPLE